FSEIELEDWLSTQGVQSLNSALRIERLYADISFTNQWQLRAGKFLTPFGLWNVIHAAPLVWTTTRPLVTEEHLFPSHVSGFMLVHHLAIAEQNVDISWFIDQSSWLDPRKDRWDFDHAFGARLNYEWDTHFQFGLSYLTFKNYAKEENSDFLKTDKPEKPDVFSPHSSAILPPPQNIAATKSLPKKKANFLERQHLLGLDMLWKYQGYELQAEFSYRFADQDQGQEKNAYLQTVIPLVPTLFAIGRYEYSSGDHLTDDDLVAHQLHMEIIGMAWRPYPPLIVKGEYRFSDDNHGVAPRGLFASVSLFF
ncbi:MAG: hypothetical protein RL637_488, partial [Pseudomonadota bacterium]